MKANSSQWSKTVKNHNFFTYIECTGQTYAASNLKFIVHNIVSCSYYRVPSDMTVYDKVLHQYNNYYDLELYMHTTIIIIGN